MPRENLFNKIELPVLISINLANHHNCFKQWKGSAFCFNSGFPFFGIGTSWGGQLWIEFVVVFPALPDFSCWNLSTSLRAATSVEATASTTSTPWNTLRYNLMWWALWPNNATMFYHNLSPNFEYSQFFFPISLWLVWQLDHRVICCGRTLGE